MDRPRGFPHYDDIESIDTNAVARKAPTSGVCTPISDPSATSYTEMYCEPVHDVEKVSKPHYYR